MFCWWVCVRFRWECGEVGLRIREFLVLMEAEFWFCVLQVANSVGGFF